MIEMIQEMLSGGFTAERAGLMLSYLVAGGIVAYLVKLVRMKSASMEISGNDNISFDRDVGTWLMVGTSTGCIRCKCAKRTGTRCYLQVAETGGLLDLSTERFRTMDKHILPSTPEGVSQNQLFQIK